VVVVRILVSRQQRHWLWPMCLSTKLRLWSLLFTQYTNTWLVRIRLCRLLWLRLNGKILVLKSEWILSAKLLFAVASFLNSTAQFCKACLRCSNSIRLSVVMSKYRTNCPVYLWWAFTVKKLADKRGFIFIDHIGRDSRRLQLLFQSDAEKSW